MPAVGKSTLAESISDHFCLRNISSGSILQQIAKVNGYLVEGFNWWETDAGFAFSEKRLKVQKFDRLLDNQIRRILDDDNVVLTARATPWLYKGDCIKIWLKASQETRAKRLNFRDQISFDEALKLIERRDANDKRLILFLYNIKLRQ